MLHSFTKCLWNIDSGPETALRAGMCWSISGFSSHMESCFLKTLDRGWHRAHSQSWRLCVPFLLASLTHVLSCNSYYLFNTWYALHHPCLVITLCLTSGWLWQCYIGLLLSVFGILGLVGKALDAVFLLLLWWNKQVIGSLASWQSLKFNATWKACRMLLLACLKICPDVATLNPHLRPQQRSFYFLSLDVTPVDAQ